MSPPPSSGGVLETFSTPNSLPSPARFSPSGPRLSGASYNLAAGISEAGTDIFHTGGNYWKNLALIRAGTLPFFFLAGLTLKAWARRYFDGHVMVAAILLFTSLPPILGHGALATVDLACASTCLLALYRYQRFLDVPGWPNGVLLLLATTLAFACKFSSLPFLFAGGAVLSVLRFDAVAAIVRPLTLRRAAGLLALTAVSVTLLIWATYGFALVPIGDSPSAAICIAYFGSAHLAAAGLPPFTQLDPVQPAIGYVAVSLRMLTIETCRTGAFRWLESATPIERIGNSMLLYYLPAKESRSIQ